MLALSDAMAARTVAGLAFNKAASESFSPPTCALRQLRQTNMKSASSSDSLFFCLVFGIIFGHIVFQPQNNHLHSELPLISVWPGKKKKKHLTGNCDDKSSSEEAGGVVWWGERERCVRGGGWGKIQA